MKKVAGFLCLLLLALVVSTKSITVGDDCYDVSFANRLADALTRLTVLSAEASVTDAQNLAQQITQVFDKDHSKFKSAAYIATSFSDIFLVTNCRSPVYSSDPTCLAAGTRYIFLVRHPAAFGGSTDLFTFPVDDATLSVDMSATPLSRGVYDPVARPWWPIVNNWSDPYADYLSGVTLATLVLNLGENAKVGVDRESGEPCTFCYTNKDVIPLVTSAAQSTSEHSDEFTSSRDFDPIVRRLLGLMVQAASRYTFAVYTGFDNDDFFGVWNCRVAPQDYQGPCNETTQYYAAVASATLFGDHQRRYYAIDEEKGKVCRSLISVSPREYFPTQRPWYQTGNGWTRPYTFATGQVTSRTYATSFVGGVVGGDLNFDQPCSLQQRKPKKEEHHEEEDGPDNEFNFIFSGMIPARK